MEIVQLGDVYLVKNGSEYIGGKFGSVTAAQAAIDSLPVFQFEAVWIYVIGNDRNVITEDDIARFIAAQS